MKTRQLWNTTWVPVGGYEFDICCGCGLTHKVFYRWNARKKRLEERWSTVKKRKRAHVR